MNRRAFLGTMLGAGAAVALPSEVWPFRKIFVPTFKRWFDFDWAYKGSETGYVWTANGSQKMAIEALQLEIFEKEIPDLLYRDSAMYNLIRYKHAYMLSQRPYRVPIRDLSLPARETEHGIELLHAKATPRNIKRWIDGLNTKSQG